MAVESRLWERTGKDILASPNNDDLRLEFARLLEEGEREGAEGHPVERARLIRLQLALALMNPSDSEWMRLATEADSLLLDHQEEWIPGWYEEAGVSDPEFHRGFIECVTVSMLNLSVYREKLYEASPIRHLDIIDLLDPETLGFILAQLEEQGFLDRMISMRLDGHELRDDHVALLNRPSLSRLRWLSLAHNNIGYKGALALTEGHLSNLEFVDLHGNPFDPVEQLNFDQGIVVGQSSGHVGIRFPRTRWLNRRVISGLHFNPSRYESVRGVTNDNPEEGSGEGPEGTNRQSGGSKQTVPEEVEAG